MIVIMVLTALLMLMMSAASAAEPDDTVRSHVVAVATARATIVSGVSVGGRQERQNPDVSEGIDAKRRERPCPERPQEPCRLIVTDLP